MAVGKCGGAPGYLPPPNAHRIVDVYDALATTRSSRGAMSPAQAVSEITPCRNSWSPGVYEAFMRAVAEPALAAEQRQELAA